MSTLVKARGLSKHYGNLAALDNVDFDIEEGCIVGLIGPNGAGKTTALKSVLGLTDFEGELDVLGHDPRQGRHVLMQHVCFIADVAVLPRWLRVSNAIEYARSGAPQVQPRARHAPGSAPRSSKRARWASCPRAWWTQLHLALVMAIDAKLLVLDEPTLGLDILYRKEFYTNLLNDYFDEQRTIIVTTHQVEEIEKILTHLMFIDNGKVTLNSSMEKVAEDYAEVLVAPDKAAAAQALKPLYEREVFGKRLFLFEGVGRDELAKLGEIHTPSVADIFVAKVKGAMQ